MAGFWMKKPMTEAKRSYVCYNLDFLLMSEVIASAKITKARPTQ
jgi:hypothetical protein